MICLAGSCPTLMYGGAEMQNAPPASPYIGDADRAFVRLFRLKMRDVTMVRKPSSRSNGDFQTDESSEQPAHKAYLHHCFGALYKGLPRCFPLMVSSYSGLNGYHLLGYRLQM